MTSLCQVKMLRYFCIICLLICIQWTFCYDEIYDKDSKHKRYDRRYGNQIKHQSEIERRKRFHREYEEFERNPVAKFDVASFIQNPDEEAVEDNQLFEYSNTERSRTSKYHNDYGSFVNVNNEENMKQHESQDYLKVGAYNAPELNLSPPLFKDTMNAQHLDLNALSQDEMNGRKIVQSRQDKAAKGSLLENNRFHSPENKCPFKNMKFPFFSRSKSVKLKPKKNKKRKLFCGNCPKKNDSKGQTTKQIVNKLSDQSQHEDKFYKRSYQERLCPACKKKFIENADAQPTNKRRDAKKFFHNSRQFFQDINDVGNDKFRKEDGITKGNTVNLRKIRREVEDNDRQMKELQEVEKKVDSTEIKMSTYQKSTG